MHTLLTYTRISWTGNISNRIFSRKSSPIFGFEITHLFCPCEKLAFFFLLTQYLAMFGRWARRWPCIVSWVSFEVDIEFKATLVSWKILTTCIYRQIHIIQYSGKGKKYSLRVTIPTLHSGIWGQCKGAL